MSVQKLKNKKGEVVFTGTMEECITFRDKHFTSFDIPQMKIIGEADETPTISEGQDKKIEKVLNEVLETSIDKIKTATLSGVETAKGDSREEKIKNMALILPLLEEKVAKSVQCCREILKLREIIDIVAETVDVDDRSKFNAMFQADPVFVELMEAGGM